MKAIVRLKHMSTNQGSHVWALLGLTIFFYIVSSLSTLLFAFHKIGSDALNPQAMNTFLAVFGLMLLAVDPHAPPTPPPGGTTTTDVEQHSIVKTPPVAEKP